MDIGGKEVTELPTERWASRKWLAGTKGGFESPALSSSLSFPAAAVSSSIS